MSLNTNEKIVLDKQAWFELLHEIFPDPPSLVVVENCRSTMELAHLIIDNQFKDFISKNKTSFTACFSLTQSEGRGRIARKWLSENNGGVYLSLIDSEEMELGAMQGLSLVVGIGICNFIKSKGLIPKLKWPNDVFLVGNKVAGVLVESVSVPRTSGKKLIIGVGLNLNQLDLGEGISATSMSIVSGIHYEYERSALELTKELIKTLSLFKKTGFSYFREDWWKNSLMQDKQVNNKEVGISGIAVGLSENGALLVRTEAGIKEIHSGDVGVVL